MGYYASNSDRIRKVIDFIQFGGPLRCQPQAGTLPADGPGRPLPLLMVCETGRRRRNFEAGAGHLPMLTATLERALAGPVTGPGTVWGRPTMPAVLNCR